MGLSKRSTPLSVVLPQSWPTVSSRVASANAPSSTSNSGDAPRRAIHSASSTVISAPSRRSDGCEPYARRIGAAVAMTVSASGEAEFMPPPGISCVSSSSSSDAKARA